MVEADPGDFDVIGDLYRRARIFELEDGAGRECAQALEGLRERQRI